MEGLGVVVMLLFGVPLAGCLWMFDNPLILLALFFFCLSMCLFWKAHKEKRQQRINNMVKSGKIWM